MLAKKWVFKQFVSNNKDWIGLVAYALYKSDKSDLAAKLRSENVSEEKIAQEVANFHDHLVHQQDRIQAYKDQAISLFSKVFSDQEQEIQARHKAEIDLLNNQHKSELKKERERIYKKIKDFPGSDKTWWAMVGAWLSDGVKGVLATSLVSALLIGFLVLLTSDVTRSEIIAKVVKEIIQVDVASNQDKKND